MPKPRSSPAARGTYQRGEHLYRRGRVWYARGGILGREGVSLHTRDAAEWTIVDRAEGTQRTLHAVGFDLDALAVMGSAPPCELFALSRPPHAIVEAA